MSGSLLNHCIHHSHVATRRVATWNSGDKRGPEGEAGAASQAMSGEAPGTREQRLRDEQQDPERPDQGRAWV